MTNFHFKCHFPKDYFDTIPIKLRIGDRYSGRIFSGREKTIEVDNQPKKISLRVHQHHVKLFLESDTSEDRYFIIKWKGQTDFQRYINALGFRGFEIIEVNKNHFENFNHRIYKSDPRAAVDLDRFSMIALGLLSSFFAYQSLFSTMLPEDIKEYTLFLFIIGLSTVISIYFDRHRMSLLDARLRIFSNSLLHLILIGWMALESYEGTWLLFLPVITLAVRAGMMLSVAYKAKSKVSIQEE